MQRFFPLIFSISLISISLGLLFLFLMEYFIPAWQEFLIFENPWLCAVLVLLVCPLLGLINLPASIPFLGRSCRVNVLSVLISATILFYVYLSIHINWKWEHMIPFLFSMMLFFNSSYATPKGAHIYPFTFWVNGFVTLFILHAILGHEIQQFLWFAFASQFIPLLLIDIIRSSQSAKLMKEDEVLYIGQGGARASLWVAPSLALLLSYLAHTFFWKSSSSILG